jgi:hypothetical protein
MHTHEVIQTSPFIHNMSRDKKNIKPQKNAHTLSDDKFAAILELNVQITQFFTVYISYSQLIRSIQVYVMLVKNIYSEKKLYFETCRNSFFFVRI